MFKLSLLIHILSAGGISSGFLFLTARSDTPLLYKIVPAWFVKVADHVDKMLAAVAKTRWYSDREMNLTDRVPTFVQERRFANWISNAQDWNISRNRYWGTPLPLWTSDDFSEVVITNLSS